MKIINNKSFKDLTTFHIGGKIRHLAEIENKDEIAEVVRFAKDNNLKIFIIGGGSDFLVSDKEFEGLVIKFIGSKCNVDGNLVTGEAGMDWDDLVEVTVANNLQGMECLSGIPGTVGASPIQNIGAYGQEMSDTFYKLEAYDIKDEKFVTFNKSECEFGYRESIFKKKEHWQRYIIVNVTFKLNSDKRKIVIYESLKNIVNEGSTLEEIRNAVLSTRREKLENPADFGNAGSFFKNPIIDLAKRDELLRSYPEAKIFPFKDKFKVFAGWLIENAGMKGKELGGAAVSPKHALILINKTGSATASEVYDLSELIIFKVNEKFGIKLEREVQLINF